MKQFFYYGFRGNMKVLVILSVLIICPTCSVIYYIDKDGVHIRYDVTFVTKCRIGEDRFRRILGIGLPDCARECGLRSHCKALSYHRRKLLMCDLFTTENESNLSNGGCTYIRASDIKVEKSPCETCPNGQVCDMHSKSCKFKECSGIQLNNCTVLGNMHGVGSTIRYQCHYGYTEKSGVKNAVCSEEGEWNTTAECERTCVNAPLVANGRAVLDTVDMNKAFVTCDSWFETTDSTVTCIAPGRWTQSVCKHVTCYNDTAYNYKGKINYTNEGIECLRWDSVPSRWTEEEYFRNETIEEAGNYCRNPYHAEFPPWCLVSLDGEDFGYCDITECNGST